MQFCEQCYSILSKQTNNTQGNVGINFECRCGLTYPGGPADTLMFEENLETTESNLKHQDFIINAPFDTARHIVRKDCPRCGLDFMTSIRIGTTETTILTCTCGYRK